MGDTSLKERLKGHSDAFDSLLSLIPAKLYYGEDTSDQWQRKKQTKQEKVLARRAKLDPDSELNRSAKEVMDEKARSRSKRKVLQMEEEDEVEDEVGEDGSEVEGREKPGEGLKRRKLSPEVEKNPRTEQPDGEEAHAQGDTDAKEEKPLTAKQEERLLKKQMKAERKAEKKVEKAEKNKAKGSAGATAEDESKDVATNDPEEAVAEKPREAPNKDLDATPFEGLGADQDHTAKPDSISHVSTPVSPTFDPPLERSISAGTSISSTAADDAAVSSGKRTPIKVPTDTTALRARLSAKIAALRAARKADGPDGKPIRTRQELIESRRAKEAQRKAHKAELRKQAKEAEEAKREEALASARASPMMNGGFGSPIGENSGFSFGRVAFADGSQMSRDLSYIKEGATSGKKAPNDPKAALAKLEAEKKRIAEMDDTKRKDVLEKESWLAARRKVEGVKIKDDENLLKKAVKRKEKQKQKSANEWAERKENVENGIKQRQAKREANLTKRREDKTLAKMGIKNKKKSGGPKKARAGFEGTGFGKRR